MRNAFNEYYGLTEEEIDRIWGKALLVLDTNVLLSLYRLQSEARKEILVAISKYKDRLWMPFQVGYEYHEHRLEEACRPVDSLKRLQGKVNDFVKSIENEYGKHPYLLDFKNIKRSLTTLSEKVSKQTTKSIEVCPDFVRGDNILEEITKLYDGKVGKSYNEERLAEIYKEGEVRYEKKVPPGYKDKDKKTGDRHRFGDLIIWYQMIEKAIEADCDIIFVTDDKKEDWWQMHNGDKIGVRRELIAEFRARTGNHLICFYTPDRFLSIAKESGAVTIKKATIEEVKYSDYAKQGQDALFGESTTLGQFATESNSVSLNCSMAESEKGHHSLSDSFDSSAIGDVGLSVRGINLSPITYSDRSVDKEENDNNEPKK